MTLSDKAAHEVEVGCRRRGQEAILSRCRRDGEFENTAGR